MKTKLRQAPLTPKERQHKIRDTISAAIRSGTVNDYYWFVCMIVPPAKRSGPDDDGDGRVACWPGVQVPVIPLAHDMTGDFAQLLTDLFIQANDRESSFYPSLSTRERLDFFEPEHWYVWGELQEDRICGRCGQVYRTLVNAPVVCDCQSYQRPTSEPAGYVRIYRSFVDDVTYERKAG